VLLVNGNISLNILTKMAARRGFIAFTFLVAIGQISGDCPPTQPDISATICFPELVPGKPVPECTHCITTCRYNKTSFGVYMYILLHSMQARFP
jgi:hypothetical protein